MVGYSGTDAPTPFILLANGTVCLTCGSRMSTNNAFIPVQTRLPQAMVLDAIENGSLLSCARLLIRFVSVYVLIMTI